MGSARLGTMRTALVGMLGVGAAMLGGCETDSFLDPSVVGRWERTPTIVPILDRIAVIERAGEQQIEHSDVEPRDLIPEIETYRARPGDVLEVSIVGLFQNQVLEPFQRRVDSEGTISLPQIGNVFIAGLTPTEIRDAIASKMAEEQIASDPIISIVPLNERERQFNLIGSVTAPGTYLIPAPDYRLLQALSVGGAFNQNAEHVFVIRQVPLTDEASGRPGRRVDTQPEPGDADPRPTDDAPPGSGEDLLDIIDDLSQPPEGDAGGGLSAFGGSPMAPVAMIAFQPETDPAPEPVVDLIEDGETGSRDQPAGGRADDARWIYLDGQWIRAERAGSGRARPDDSGSDADGSRPAPGEPLADDGRSLVTQRIIRVPLKPLLEGDARYNVVVRPGDTIRVPVPASGTIFMMGQVARPGAFQLSEDLTLTNAIASAGGLSGIAIPERVDLTRMVGNDRAATIRVDLRAIMEGTQPDLYLKRNDRINVGTNFWAFPLAVIRNGFRASYGFGFLLDRNFGNDVFGAPPTNVGNN